LSISVAPYYTRKQVGTSVTLAIVAFLAYTSVYAYRKPFTVATYDNLVFAGIKYQTLLIICQGLGYMLSKFFGIRFIAELGRYGRWKTSAILIGTAWLSLGIFALLPAPWGLLCLFVNGFVLGFMWGIVFSYVEGRRATDFIGAVMAVSFIFAGGFTRSVALWLRDSWQVGEQWLAFVTGCLFIVPLALLLYLLEKTPPPDENDVLERTQRLPMTGKERRQFFKRFGSGVIAVTVGYLFLTIMRDVRDNFMVNIFSELGYGSKPAIFTQTETSISLVILLVMGLLVFVRKNIRALKLVHVVVITGFLLAGISSALFITGLLNGLLWMQLVGLGLYMGYIPFNCIFFERLIAAFKITGNVGFLIYVVDAWGYLGSSAVMLSKEVFKLNLTWTQFYPISVVIFCIVGLLGTIYSWIYFSRNYKQQNSNNKLA
jgi:MFS family permease